MGAYPGGNIPHHPYSCRYFLFYPRRAKERAQYLYTKIQAGRRSRYHQLGLILGNEYAKVKRSKEFSLLPDLSFKKKKVLCLGCKSPLLDAVVFPIIHNGEELNLEICKDCKKDPAD